MLLALLGEINCSNGLFGLLAKPDGFSACKQSRMAELWTQWRIADLNSSQPRPRMVLEV